MMRARLGVLRDSDRERIAHGLFVLASPPGGEFLVDSTRMISVRAKAKLQALRLPLCAAVVSTAAVSTLVWVGAHGFGGEAASDPAASVPTHQTVTAPPLRERAVRPNEDRLSPTAVVTADPTPLRIRVTSARDGGANEGKRVDVIELCRPNAHLSPRTQFTDSDGIAEFDALADGPLRVRLAGGLARELDGGSRRPTEVSITIPLGVSVHGRVVDDFGASSGGAEIMLEDPESRSFSPVTRAADDGSFVLDDVAPGTRILARGDAHAPAAIERVAGPRGATITPTLFVTSNAARLAGRIVEPTGLGTRTRLVIVTHLPRDGDEVALEFESRDDGAIDCAGIPPGPARCIARSAACWRTERDLELTPHAIANFDITLQRGSTISGRVTHASGSFAAFVRAHVHAGGPLGVSEVRATESGEFCLVGLPPAAVLAFAAPDGASAIAPQSPDFASETIVDVCLKTPTPRFGVIRNERGDPCAGLEVRAITSNASVVATATTASDGTFRLPTLDRAVDLVVYAPQLGAPIARRSLVGNANDPLAITIGDAARTALRIHGRIESGGDATTWIRFATTEGIDAGDLVRIAPDGSFVSGDLPPGRYRAFAFCGDGRRAESEELSLAPGQDTWISLPLAPLVSLTIEALAARDSREYVEIVDLSNSVISRVRCAELPRSMRLAQGSYRLRTIDASGSPVECEFQVESTPAQVVYVDSRR